MGVKNVAVMRTDNMTRYLAIIETTDGDIINVFSEDVDENLVRGEFMTSVSNAISNGYKPAGNEIMLIENLYDMCDAKFRSNVPTIEEVTLFLRKK